MTSPLDNLCDPGKALKAEPPDAAEFAGLKRSANARLKDATNTSLSLEGRFDLAYNAAHALCLAALRWHGYRPGNRYIVFQVLPHTLALGPEVWRVLAKCHDIRNLGAIEVRSGRVPQAQPAIAAFAAAAGHRLDTGVSLTVEFVLRNLISLK